MWKSLLLVLLAFTGISSQKPCVPQTKSAGIVCVCNSTYCDEVPPLGVLQPDQVAVYTTSESGQRFARTNLNFTSNSSGQVDVTITINSSITYQQIQGFGTAFTGSASFNVMNLPIPVMKIAQSLIGANLKLFGSPWSGPAWMKTMDNMNSLNQNTMKGSLVGNNETTKWWNTYANYFYKFFDEHAKQNITFWGLTIQNEPTIQTNAVGMYLTAEVERDFIKYFLGPKMKSDALTKNLKIMIWDFNRGGAEDYTDIVLADQLTSSYVDGIAMHWYDDIQVGINSTVPENIHNKHPNFWILNTEACNGLWEIRGVTLGNWTRGELYAHDIMDNLNHWSTGWVDWNLALNERGGPPFFNPLDAPIVVANDNLTFYKQPMFYTFGHFSKFIRPDSYRIATTWGNPQGNLEGGSFITPTNQIVIVLHNRDDNKNYTVSIKDAQNSSEAITINIEKKSIVTLIWNKHCACPAGNWYQSITDSCNCYNFIQTPKDWQSSNNDCRQQNPKASLASIDSAFENNEILSVLKNQTSCSQAFIGLKQTSNSWSWINNDTSIYRNWRSGFPSSNSNNIYSQLNIADGKWTNIDGTAQGCYVCEVKA